MSEAQANWYDGCSLEAQMVARSMLTHIRYGDIKGPVFAGAMRGLCALLDRVGPIDELRVYANGGVLGTPKPECMEERPLARYRPGPRHAIVESPSRPLTVTEVADGVEVPRG